MARNLTGGKSPSRKPLTFEVRRDDIISSLEVTYDTNFTQDNVPVWDDTNQAFVPSLYYFDDDVITLEDGIGNDLYSIDSNHIGALQEATDPNTENPFQTRSDIQEINHADLQNLNTENYTHLTATQATDLTDGGETTLHSHAVSIISAQRAVNRTGGGDQNVKICSITITQQYYQGRVYFTLFGGGYGNHTHANLSVYVAQLAALGEAPIVRVKISSLTKWLRHSDVHVITTTNDGSSTVVEVWLELRADGATRLSYLPIYDITDYFPVTPVFYTGSSTGALPAGTETTCYSDHMMGSGVPTFDPEMDYCSWTNTDDNSEYHLINGTWVMMTQTDPSTGGGIV
jgi:hypothetical protein